MVKIIAPLMSHTASGKIGPRLVFSRRASGQQVRFQKAQKDVITESRILQRTNYQNAVSSWNSLTQIQKDSYNLIAVDKRMSGYNYYISLAIDPYFFKFLDVDYVNLIARMVTIPSLARRKLIVDFIIGLKSDLGISLLSQKFDCMWFLASHDRSDSYLNWVKNAHSLIEVGSLTFTTDRGFVGGATSKYLRTQFLDNSSGINYLTNNSSLGVYVNTNIADSGVDIGIKDIITRGSYVRSRSASNVLNGHVRSLSSMVNISSIMSSIGLSVFSRLSSSVCEAFKNGLSVGSANITSFSGLAGEYYILAIHQYDALAESPSSRRVAFAFIASGNINQAMLYSRVLTYLSAIGAS